MYCPKCGQERISADTNYCSRCGFLLAGTAELLLTGGLFPQNVTAAAKNTSPRKKGLKQGLFIFLLTFLVVPIVAIFTVAINVEPYAVAISAIALFMGGLLRMAYALMFEPNEESAGSFENDIRHLVSHQRASAALPPQHSVPAQVYVNPAAGNWRDTNDLQPASVTDGTTKLLEKARIDQ